MPGFRQVSREVAILSTSSLMLQAKHQPNRLKEAIFLRLVHKMLGQNSKNNILYYYLASALIFFASTTSFSGSFARITAFSVAVIAVSLTLFLRFFPLHKQLVDFWYYLIGILGVVIFFMANDSTRTYEQQEIAFYTLLEAVNSIEREQVKRQTELAELEVSIVSLEQEFTGASLAVKNAEKSFLRGNIDPIFFYDGITNTFGQGTPTFRELIGDAAYDWYHIPTDRSWLDREVSEIEVALGLADYYERLGRLNSSCRETTTIETQNENSKSSRPNEKICEEAGYHLGVIHSNANNTDTGRTISVANLLQTYLKKLETHEAFSLASTAKWQELVRRASTLIDLEDLRWEYERSKQRLERAKELNDQLMAYQNKPADEIQAACEEAVTFLTTSEILSPKSNYFSQLSLCAIENQFESSNNITDYAARQASWMKWYLEYGWHFLAILLLGSKLARKE